MSSTDETGETDKTVKLLGISSLGCDKQRWRWTTTCLSSAKRQCHAFSSFESKWMLEISYSKQQQHYGCIENGVTCSFNLCLIGGAENAEISYKISTRFVTEQDASVKRACAV